MIYLSIHLIYLFGYLCIIHLWIYVLIYWLIGWDIIQITQKFTYIIPSFFSNIFICFFSSDSVYIPGQHSSNVNHIL